MFFTFLSLYILLISKQLCGSSSCLCFRHALPRFVPIMPLVLRTFIGNLLASGLLYVSELIEEHSSVAKSIGKRGIYVSLYCIPASNTTDLPQVIVILHGVLYFTESLPLRHTLFSVFCHIVYLQNFSYTWPVISLTSLSFIGSCIFVIVDHFLWFFYFARITQEARHPITRTHKYAPAPPAKNVPSFAEIATFFGVCVWLAPLFLFLSLSANDNALPTTAGMQHLFCFNDVPPNHAFALISSKKRDRPTKHTFHSRLSCSHFAA